MILTYYIVYIICIIIFKKERQNVLETNKRLDSLRYLPKKTIEEQRAFINTKFPKRQKRNWTFWFIIKGIWNILIYILIYTGIFLLINYIFNKLGIDVPWWAGLMFVILFPLMMNWVLGKLNLQTNDLTSLIWTKRGR
jgi:hypothetical protein